MAPPIAADTVIAGFRVRSPLGAGAMGAVYLAEDVRTGEPVALKVLADELAGDERFRQRFIRESELAATLEHPGVVRVVSSGESDGLLFLAMAYLEGQDLREIIRRVGSLDPPRAVRLIGQAAEGLDAAHAAGLVHRDVKPANILVGSAPDGERACVCDFGLARHASSAGSLTGDRGFLGTIDYVPPEQIAGGPIDRRADVYSLGCVLFECLAGSRPFERETDLSVIFAHLNEPPPRLSHLRPELAFDDVFAKALAKAPEQRYATCGELAQAARAALRGGAVPAETTTRRRRVRIAATALVAVAVAGVALALATRGAPTVAPTISETAIDGVMNGRTAAFYKKRLGGYRQSVVAGPGYLSLAFQQPELAVYFPAGGKHAIILTTWNPLYRTAKGIGPCSTITAMKKVYGAAVAPAWSGTNPNDPTDHGSYVVGDNLLFVTQDKRTISAVALYRGTPGNTRGGSPQAYANYIAANETACIAG